MHKKTAVTFEHSDNESSTGSRFDGIETCDMNVLTKGQVGLSLIHISLQTS